MVRSTPIQGLVAHLAVDDIRVLLEKLVLRDCSLVFDVTDTIEGDG